MGTAEKLRVVNVKGKRISCPPHHDYEHGFPLIRSLRASTQRSTSVLFSFVLSLLIVAGSFCHPAIKNDSSAIPRFFEIADVVMRRDHVVGVALGPGSLETVPDLHRRRKSLRAGRLGSSHDRLRPDTRCVTAWPLTHIIKSTPNVCRYFALTPSETPSYQGNSAAQNIKVRRRKLKCRRPGKKPMIARTFRNPITEWRSLRQLVMR